MITKIKNSLKKNPYLYFLVWLIRDRDLRKNYIEYYFNRKKIFKSRSKINREVKLLHDYWACPPYHYYRYKLYDKDLTEAQLLDYVPAFYFYNYHMEVIYRGLDLSIIEDKIKAHYLFIHNGIPTPNMVGYVLNNQIFSEDKSSLTQDQLIERMNLSPSDKFFCKPATGKGGSGIFVISKNRGVLEVSGDVNVRQFIQKAFSKNNYIIQEGIVQRTDISQLNKTSVNTLRIITQIRDNKPQISIAIIRIGRNLMYVDNSAKGGISAEVDRETGKLSKYAYTEHDMKVFDNHPDNGLIFESFKISEWESITNEICNFATKLRIYNELAWDIAIGSDKVYVIEVNSYYGIDHLQCCSGGVARKLNIRNIHSKF